MLSTPHKKWHRWLKGVDGEKASYESEKQTERFSISAPDETLIEVDVERGLVPDFSTAHCGRHSQQTIYTAPVIAEQLRNPLDLLEDDRRRELG